MPTARTPRSVLRRSYVNFVRQPLQRVDRAVASVDEVLPARFLLRDFLAGLDTMAEFLLGDGTDDDPAPADRTEEDGRRRHLRIVVVELPELPD